MISRGMPGLTRLQTRAALRERRRHADSELRLTRGQEDSGRVIEWMAFAFLMLVPSCATGYQIVGLVARAMGWA